MKKTPFLILVTFLIPTILFAEEKFCDENGHCYTKQGDSSQWYEPLIKQGFVPAGTRPKTIVEEGGTPGYYQTDSLSTANRELNRLSSTSQKEQLTVEERILRKVAKEETLTPGEQKIYNEVIKTPPLTTRTTKEKSPQ